MQQSNNPGSKSNLSGFPLVDFERVEKSNSEKQFIRTNFIVLFIILHQNTRHNKNHIKFYNSLSLWSQLLKKISFAPSRQGNTLLLGVLRLFKYFVDRLYWIVLERDALLRVRQTIKIKNRGGLRFTGCK